MNVDIDKLIAGARVLIQKGGAKMPRDTRAKKNKPAEFQTPVACILLEGANYNFGLFAEQFQKTWQYNTGPYRDGRTFGMIVDGMIIGCALIPSPVTDPALLQSARDSVLWPEAEICVSKHNAHLLVTLTREKGPIPANVLLTKVIYCLLRQKNVTGVYLRPGLFEPAYYIKCAEPLFAEKLPTELWVHINSIGFDKNEGFTFYTSGMNQFGKPEFEILETRSNFIDTYYMLKELIRVTITSDAHYKDGDTVKSPDGGKFSLSVSNGVKAKGPAIKINM